MSPQSRPRSQPPGGPGHGAALPGPYESSPEGLFAEMLRAARELLAVRSPLDAELLVSEMLGTWWGPQALMGLHSCGPWQGNGKSVVEGSRRVAAGPLEFKRHNPTRRSSAARFDNEIQ